ncbi:MAG: hypothetical protein Q4F05_14385 [bacterium]|nr:hypothetical protein [bacterium]
MMEKSSKDIVRNGDIIYYEEDGRIHWGKVKNLTESTFQVENFGCCCEGDSTISRDMIGYTFFLEREELEKRQKL